jgi:adenylosuccinate synthase
LTRHRLDVIRDFYEVEKDPNEDVQVSAMTSWASRLRGISPVNHAIKNTVGDVIFEGAQGVLLDQDYGFHPHTTWSDTTSARAEEIWDKHGDGPITRIGVTRSFLTRHGEGPFPTEDWFPDETEKHNDSTGHAGEFRTGHLDLVLLRYALEVNPVDCLFVTWMDIGEEFLDSFRIPVATDYFFINPPLSDISPYFRDGHLNPPPVFLPNHAWMESVTRRLFHAKPKMDHIEKDAFLLWLSANTKTPVRFWSKGPTWKDVSEVQMVGDPTAIKEEAM